MGIEANRLEVVFAPEPSDLAFGITTGGLLDGFRSLGEGGASGQEFAHLADADGAFCGG